MPKIVNRVFYIDVSAVSVNDVPAYMEAVKKSLRSEQKGFSKVLKKEGMWEDLFFPVRNSETRVEYYLVDIETGKIVTNKVPKQDSVKQLAKGEE